MSTIKVGYLSPITSLGPDKTTFGYMAAEKYFSQQMDEIELINLPSQEEICYAVARQELDHGVVAVENYFWDKITFSFFRAFFIFSSISSTLYCDFIK